MGKDTVEKGEVLYLEIGWGKDVSRVWVWRCTECGKIIMAKSYEELATNALRHKFTHKEKE